MRRAELAAARRPRSWPALACLAAVAVACGVGAFVQAQDTKSEGDGRERLSRLVTADTGEVLVAAQDLLGAGDYAGALERLSRLRLERLSPYERGRTEYYFFLIAFAQERYDAARAHLDAMIGSGGLNEQEMAQARFEHARLFLVEERWAEGAAALEQWLTTAVNPNAQAYYLLAAAHYQLADYDSALPPAKAAVDLTAMRDAASAQLLLAVYAARAEYARGIPLLERLLVMHPEDKRWWLQLSAYHGLLENHAAALAVLELAQHAGLITAEAELLRLADLAAVNGIPYRCASVMTRGLERAQIAPSEEAYKRTGNCWLAARELDRSLAPLTHAAELGMSGDNFLRLAEVQAQREDWEAVVSAADRGIAKGRLEDPGKAYMLKGIALFKLARKAEARASFEGAAGFPRHLPMAREYIRMIDSEN